MSLNKLKLEQSAYLLQHAENPVDWYPFGPEAFEKSKELDRPIFLSIGYSSCHWCHVMNHESFADQEVASRLNKFFICIKVDREEFPEVDHLYQQIAAQVNGRGGWPLSVFLTPERAPIFLGTYFPLKPSHGLPAFGEVIQHISELYVEKKQELHDEGLKTMAELRSKIVLEKKIDFPGHFPSPQSIMQALSHYADKKHGGFGKAPKFPQFAFLNWGAEQILEGMIPQEHGQHIVTTVERMLMGGTYDHLKGGIHRYSVDEAWLVPHFEKMLYDQSGLLKVLSKVCQFYPSPLIFDALIQTLDYLESEMVHEKLYFMASQDADSEGHEGLYFTFSLPEFLQTLKDEEGVNLTDEQLKSWFGLTETGNFEKGLNVISLNPDVKEEYYSPEGWQKVRRVRELLLEERKMRIPPATDPKGIASWNFMLVSSLCDVVQYVRVPSICQKAIDLLQKTLDPMTKTFLTEKDGDRHRLKHVTTTDKTPVYLEDYVTFAESQFRIYEVIGLEHAKVNTQETLKYIVKEFVRDQTIFLVSSKAEDADVLKAPMFDQSFQSMAAILLRLLARFSVIDPGLHPDYFFKDSWQDWKQLALSNPVAHGEALRVFTYPLDLYRKIEVSRKWIHDPKFQNMRSHFLGRFIMNYHDNNNDDWQICNREACELNGKDLDSFLKVFGPKESKEEGHA